MIKVLVKTLLGLIIGVLGFSPIFISIYFDLKWLLFVYISPLLITMFIGLLLESYKVGDEVITYFTGKKS